MADRFVFDFCLQFYSKDKMTSIDDKVSILRLIQIIGIDEITTARQ